MLAFSRITSVLFFVLSLSFFAYAAPTPAYNSNEVAPSYEKGQQLLSLTTGLQTNIKAAATLIGEAETLAKVATGIDVMVGHVETCTNAIVALGGNIDVDVTLKLNIALEIVACISIIVQTCIALVAKFGALVLITLLVKLDICLQALIVALRVCIDDIIVVIVAHLKVDVAAMVQAHLGLCVNLLQLVHA